MGQSSFSCLTLPSLLFLARIHRIHHTHHSQQYHHIAAHTPRELPPPPPLLGLPVELLSSMSSLLPNRDIKSLRLVYRGLHSAIPLRLTRVFLSANPLNIEVFRAVADHDVFR